MSLTRRLVEGDLCRPVPGGLFHSPAFFGLHLDGDGAYLRWDVDGRTSSVVHFTDVGDGLWRSPGRGTFSGWASEDDVDIESLSSFVDAAEQHLADRGARRLEVLPAPMAHDPERFSRALWVLRTRGWQLSRCDLDQALVVDDRPLVERMSRGNAKRLRKCERDGFSTAPLGAADLPEVYEVLAANRSANHRVLSMSLAQLQHMAAVLPLALELFGTRDRHGVLAAAAIGVRLEPSVLHVYAWGHRPTHAGHSPVVHLADGLHAHCRRTGTRLLDLGTSTVDTSANDGLLRFKQGLGCSDSLKITMRKDLG